MALRRDILFGVYLPGLSSYSYDIEYRDAKA